MAYRSAARRCGTVAPLDVARKAADYGDQRMTLGGFRHQLLLIGRRDLSEPSARRDPRVADRRREAVKSDPKNHIAISIT